MIDIFVPVLGRPYAAEPLVQSVIDATVDTSFRITFICSKDDDEEIEACMRTGEDVIVMSMSAGASDYPKKMNAAFRDTEQEWILLAADDLEFQRNWDSLALHVAEKTEASVVATNDMANAQVRSGRFGTHCLVRRSYVIERGASADGPGILVHEGYDHNFCDRELCAVAQSRGVYAFAAQSVIHHRHPHFDRRQPMDDTYRKGLARFHDDQRLFYSRSKLWGYAGLSTQEQRVARGRAGRLPRPRSRRA